jgi:hypothetical protein
VHLGIYRFDGDPDTLLAAYEQLTASIPPDGSTLHLCVRRPDGIKIYDTCPSREVIESFSRSEGFLGALAAAGLPAPLVEGQAVHDARVRGERL